MSDWTTLRDLIAQRGINGQVIVSAELGLNHNGDLSLAMKMIDAAAEAGCQAVKVQNYRTGDVVTSRGEKIVIAGQAWNAWELFSRCELDVEGLRLLKTHAERGGLIFHSTPTNEQGIRDLDKLDVRILKLASDVVGNPHIVRYARYDYGQNVIASTGYLNTEVLPLYLADEPEWLWLHCVRKYPTPAQEANLGRIGEIRLLLGKYTANPLVGYSDHTEGIAACLSAVKDYQAVWIEAHVTLDKTLPGPDHRWSKDFSEMAELVRCLKK